MPVTLRSSSSEISRFHRLLGRHAWRIIVAANALALSSIAHAAEPLSFKGLRLGASKADVLRRFPSAVCPTNRSGCLLTAKDPHSGGAKIEAERESMTIATVPFDSAVFMFHSGRLDAILISARPDGFSRIALALADRYDRPTTSSASQDIVVWELPEGTIELHRSPSESSIVYSSKRRNASTPTPAEQRKKAAGDL